MRPLCFLVALAGCSATLPGDADADADTDTDTATDTDTTHNDTGTWPYPADCVYDLGLWCFNSESSEGPSQTTGACPAVDVPGLMAQHDWAWHGRCATASGDLDFVEHPTGYGGGRWYFDATGALVAYTYSTDVNLFCGGADFGIGYGARPACTDICVVARDANGNAGYGANHPDCP